MPFIIQCTDLRPGCQPGHLAGKSPASKITSRLRFFWIFTFLFCVSLGVRGANWYVDSAVTGGLNNGTSWADAWTNLDAINTIRSTFLASKVKGGDTVYISGGASSQTYTADNGASYLVPAGGTPANHINYCVGIEAGHNGTVIFDGQNLTPFWMGQGAQNVTISGNMIVTNYPNLAIYGDGSSSLKVDGLSIYGSLRFLGSSTDIILANSLIKAPNNQDFVISWGVNGNTKIFPYSSASIYGCTIMGARQNDSSGVGSDLIQFSGGGYSVYSNKFTTYFVPSFTEGQHQDGMQASGATSDVQIYDNTFENIANYMIFWSPFQSVAQTIQNVFIYNNIFQANAPMALDKGYTLAIAFSMQGGSAGTMLFTNVVIANNTFVDMFGRAAVGMGMNGIQTNVYIVNNLLYNCGGRNSDGTVANTAIGIGGNSPGWSPNGMSIQYNQIQAGTMGNNNCSPGQSIAPASSSAVQFVSYTPISPSNDLHLASNDQAARGQGMNLTALYPFLNHDKDGNLRPAIGNWDIGAYQSPASGTGTNTNSVPPTDPPVDTTTNTPPVTVTNPPPVTVTNPPPVIIVTNSPVVNPTNGTITVSRIIAPGGFHLVFQ